MKQSDIALLVIIVAISLIASYFVGNTVFSSEETRTAEIEVVQPISETFPSVDPGIFNKDKAVNLTENIRIGDDRPDNSEPFRDNQ